MKKAKIRQCVYCGEFKGTTKDHVIPKSLFTRPYPSNLITVPACFSCNNAKSLDDDFLRDLLTTDFIGSHSPVAQKIFETKVMSSAAQDSSLLVRTVLSQGRLEPFFSKGGVYLGTYPTVTIDEKRVSRMFHRIARGLYYDATKQRLPEGYTVEVLRHLPHNFEALIEEFRKKLHPSGRRLGNVFSAIYVRAKEDPFSTMWLIWFYDRVGISISILKEDEQLTE